MVVHDICSKSCNLLNNVTDNLKHTETGDYSGGPLAVLSTGCKQRNCIHEALKIRLYHQVQLATLGWSQQFIAHRSSLLFSEKATVLCCPHVVALRRSRQSTQTVERFRFRWTDCDDCQVQVLFCLTAPEDFTNCLS